MRIWAAGLAGVLVVLVVGGVSRGSAENPAPALAIGGVRVWVGEQRNTVFSSLSRAFRLQALPGPLGFAVLGSGGATVGGVSFDEKQQLSGAQRERRPSQDSAAAMAGAIFGAAAALEGEGTTACQLSAKRSAFAGVRSEQVVLDCGGRGLTLSRTQMGQAPADYDLVEWVSAAEPRGNSGVEAKSAPPVGGGPLALGRP